MADRAESLLDQHNFADELRRENEELRRMISLDEQFASGEAGPLPSFSQEQTAVAASLEPTSSSIFAGSQISTQQTVLAPIESSTSALLPTSDSVDRVASVHQLRRCLDLNLECQATIRGYIEAVQRAKLKLEYKIREQEEQIYIEREAKRHGETAKVTPFIHRLGPASVMSFRRPYFKYVYGLYPVANAEVKRKSYQGETLPSDLYYSSGWRWYDEKIKERLFREVRRECLAKLLEPHIVRRDELRNIVGELEGPAADSAYEELEEIENKIKAVVRETDGEAVLVNPGLIDRVDWGKVAKNLGGIVNHMTCRLVWYNYHSPTVNKKPFKKTEDKRLAKLTLANKKRNWIKIAKSLKTNRGAFQCLQRYQSKLAAQEKTENDLATGTNRSIWRPEDEKRLMEVVLSLDLPKADAKGASKFINWQYVAQQVGQFSKEECCEKYMKLSTKALGPWSKDEHKRLAEAVNMYGTSNWVAISSYLGTRGPRQCQDHWYRNMSRKQVEALMKTTPAPEWTAEEDTVLWFNRTSNQKRVSHYKEIAKLLPGRHRHELRMRFKQLKQWHSQAVWLVKNENTLLSLIVKSDADLTLAEMRNLRTEITRLNNKRMKNTPANVSSEEAEYRQSVSFAEQGQLERLMSAMVLEASLSRDLVRNKVQLVRDIANYKAAPVPLMRSGPKKPESFEGRAAAFEKIKEMMMKMEADRRKHQDEAKKAKKKPGAASSVATTTDDDDEMNSVEESVMTSLSPGEPKARGFGHILTKIRNAANDSRLAEPARQVLLKLERVTGGTTVGELLKIAKQLDSLVQKVVPEHIHPSSLGLNWRENLNLICQIYRCRYVSHGATRQFYANHGVPKREGFVDESAKMLVSTLGTNVDGITAEATCQRDANSNTAEEAEASVSGISRNGLALSGIGKSVLRRVCAERALRVLLSKPEEEFHSEEDKLKSLQQEFDATVHCNAEDFANNDNPPVMPPNSVTCGTWRLLVMSRLRLSDLVNENTNSDERITLTQKVEKLKQQPTEGYALLQRRFEMLFTWPAIMAKSQPELYAGRLPLLTKEPPSTPHDVVVPDWLLYDQEDNELEEETAESRPATRTKNAPKRSMSQNPFLSPDGGPAAKRLSCSTQSSMIFTPGLDEPSTSSAGLIIGAADETQSRPRKTSKKTVSQFEPHSSRLKKLKEVGKTPSYRYTRPYGTNRGQGHEDVDEDRQRADSQLNMLVPLVPLEPLEDHPFPENRIPYVPERPKPPTAPRPLLASMLSKPVLMERPAENTRQPSPPKRPFPSHGEEQNLPSHRRQSFEDFFAIEESSAAYSDGSDDNEGSVDTFGSKRPRVDSPENETAHADVSRLNVNSSFAALAVDYGSLSSCSSPELLESPAPSPPSSPPRPLFVSTQVVEPPVVQLAVSVPSRVSTSVSQPGQPAYKGPQVQRQRVRQTVRQMIATAEAERSGHAIGSPGPSTSSVRLPSTPVLSSQTSQAATVFTPQQQSLTCFAIPSAGTGQMTEGASPLPAFIQSPAVGAPLAVIQLTQADIMRMFSGGASTISIAVPLLPAAQAPSTPSGAIQPPAPAADESNRDQQK